MIEKWASAPEGDSSKKPKSHHLGNVCYPVRHLDNVWPFMALVSPFMAPVPHSNVGITVCQRCEKFSFLQYLIFCLWFKQNFIQDKIKIQRIVMCSSTSCSLYSLPLNSALSWDASTPGNKEKEKKVPCRFKRFWFYLSWRKQHGNIKQTPEILNLSCL